ncbi:hypothetical protein PG993_008971 [Apiospora rasikravindrae]|uniref:Uncharacterized protein n=1 Tax=Apiospora rasikravindrae TaxID=990691 RepID=A0ABR1SI29_9PEZI
MDGLASTARRESHWPCRTWRGSSLPPIRSAHFGTADVFEPRRGRDDHRTSVTQGLEARQSEPIAGVNTERADAFYDDGFSQFVVPVNLQRTQDDDILWGLVVVRRKQSEVADGRCDWAVDFYDPNEPKMQHYGLGLRDRREKHLEHAHAMAKRWFGAELQFDTPPCQHSKSGDANSGVAVCLLAINIMTCKTELRGLTAVWETVKLNHKSDVYVRILWARMIQRTYLRLLQRKADEESAKKDGGTKIRESSVPIHA